MNRDFRHILFFFAILSGILPIEAQEDSIRISVDSSLIKTIRFSDNLSNKYSGNEFNYDTAEGETQNLLARIFNWFFKGLQDLFGIEIPPEIRQLLETLIYILLLLAAMYFIVRLLAGKEAVSFFRNKDKLVAPVSIQEEEDIENIDLDQRISDALAAKDYRLAIRFMYLKALKELSLHNLISYHFEKTNTDYYREIADTTVKQHFNRVSYFYDYIWYGEFELDQKGFEHAKRSFDQLTTTIKSSG